MTLPTSNAFVFFGATGDLAYKKIFPVMQALTLAGDMDMPIIGMARAGCTLDKLAQHARDSLEEESNLDEQAFAQLSKRLQYIDGGYGDPETYERLSGTLGEDARPLHYVAIPPSIFGTVVQDLSAAGCARNARIIAGKLALKSASLARTG